jgi:hypothetical protein
LNSKYYEYNGVNEIVEELGCNGDFRSDVCTSILEQSDIVVNNPPFSLFRDYVSQLMKFGKKFLVVGNMNAITYKEIFPYIKDNELWLGMTWIKEFIQPNKEIKKFGNICWYTNLDNKKHNEPINLYRKYNETDYPKYDNYNAINVDKTSDIPFNYDEIMGVPITFIDKFNPDQFEILGITENNIILQPYWIPNCKKYDRPYINGERKYPRILIRKKQ